MNLDREHADLLERVARFLFVLQDLPGPPQDRRALLATQPIEKCRVRHALAMPLPMIDRMPVR